MKIIILFCGLLATVLGKKGFGPSNQEWGYVTVRANAHMFWWLHYTAANVTNYYDRPLIIWLQGGPGGSSTGYGNFHELGPIDENLKPRNSSWVGKANVLFVDNPVGTGFSYVDDNRALATTNEQIANDFVELMKGFYTDVPAMKKAPLYIFCESYGGKMTVDIALALDKAIKSKQLDIHLKGVGLGDSWISPIDSVLTWAPYLKSVGMIDEKGYDTIMEVAKRVEKDLEKGDYNGATDNWDETEGTINRVTGGVDFYNILSKINMGMRPVPLREKLLLPSASLNVIMNTLVKKALNLTHSWSEDSGSVFTALRGDFMKPVTRGVEQLLNETDITVAVYNGQLDLIVDTIGTTKWLQNLHWENGTSCTFSKGEQPFAIYGYLEGYYKICGNLHYYSILRAGHMVPLDNPAGMDFILKTVTKDFAPLEV